MTFTLTIELGNHAMRLPRDVAEMLRELGERLERSHTFADTAGAGTVRDVNGNTVGRWEVSR